MDSILKFTVERSQDQVTWTMLNDNLPADARSFTDPTLLSGTYYYRVTGYTSEGLVIPYNIVSITASTAVGALVPGWPKEGTTTSGNGKLLGVATDASNNVIAVGNWANKINFGTGDLSSVFATNVSDGFIAKYSPTGNLLWVRQIGGNGNDSVTAVTIDGSGNIIVMGNFQFDVDFGNGAVTAIGSTDMFVAKYTPDNSLLWVQHYKSITASPGTCIETDPSGNILVGATCGYGADFGGTGQTGGAFQMTPAGGPADSDFAIAKLSPATGLTSWAKRYGGNSIDSISAVAVDQSGDVYVTGSVQGQSTDLGGGSITAGGTFFNIFAARYAGSTGNYVWGKFYGVSGAGNNGLGISVDRGTGNVVITGRFANSINFGGGPLGGNGGIYIVGLDASGNFLWQKFSGGATDNGIACFISKVANGDGSRNLLVCGGAQAAIYWGGTQSLFGSGQMNPWVALFHIAGSASPSHQWTHYYGLDSNGNSIGAGTANCVAVDRLGQCLVGGQFGGSLDFGGVTLTTGTAGYTSTFVAKYTQ